MSDRFRVWYVPQIPMPAFEREYDDLVTAIKVLDAIVDFSGYEFENRVKPDYADMGGIARWEEDGAGGFGWYDVEEEEIEEARG